MYKTVFMFDLLIYFCEECCMFFIWLRICSAGYHNSKYFFAEGVVFWFFESYPRINPLSFKDVVLFLPTKKTLFYFSYIYLSLRWLVRRALLSYDNYWMFALLLASPYGICLARDSFIRLVLWTSVVTIVLSITYYGNLLTFICPF